MSLMCYLGQWGTGCFYHSAPDPLFGCAGCRYKEISINETRLGLQRSYLRNWCFISPFFGQVFLMLYQPNVMHINQLFRCNKNSTTHNRAITGQRSLQPHALLKIHHNCYGLRSQHRLVVDSFVRAVNTQYTVTCGGAQYLRQPIWFCSLTQAAPL